MHTLEKEKVIYEKFKNAIWVIDHIINNKACQEEFGENELRALNYTKNYISALIESQKERLEKYE